FVAADEFAFARRRRRRRFVERGRMRAGARARRDEKEGGGGERGGACGRSMHCALTEQATCRAEIRALARAPLTRCHARVIARMTARHPSGVGEGVAAETTPAEEQRRWSRRRAEVAARRAR